MPPVIEEPMLTSEEVGKLLQMHEKTVRRKALNGELEYVRLGPRTLRFKREWISDFLTRKQRRR